MRVEQIGLATLYLADCREVVPTLARPAAVISDPPYGLGDKMQGGTWGAKPEFREMLVWDNATPEVGHLENLIAMSPKAILWGGNYYGLPAARCWLLWRKVNAVPTMADFEMAWTNLDRPAKAWDGTVGRVQFGHPTEKPVALMRWCVEQAKVPPGGVILDPYLGSGSTGVAAVEMRHPFVGCEIHEPYFDIACRRIEQAQRQGDMFRDIATEDAA